MTTTPADATAPGGAGAPAAIAVCGGAMSIVASGIPGREPVLRGMT